MTMKVTEHKIVTEVKRHPNDVRYPCRGTHEIMDAGRKLITSLSIPERKEMLKGTLILDEDETAELFDAIMVGDVIGVGIFRGKESDTPGFTSNMYEVEKIFTENDYMECKNYYTKMSEEISFQDISIGLAMNLAEILYRDEKPYGAPTEQEWTVNIHEEVEDDEEKEEASAASERTDSGDGDGVERVDSEGTSASTTVESATVDDSSGGGDRGGDAESSKDDADGSTSGASQGDVQLPAVKASGTPDSKAVNLTVKKEEEVDPDTLPLIWPACYHAFGYLEESNTYCVIVNFRTTWDETKTLDLGGREEAICEKLGLERLSAGIYGYDHLYNETQLRQIFKSFRCDEVPYMTELINKD